MTDSKKTLLLTHSTSETESIGESIGKALGPRAIVGLRGELGAGKTVLAKGIIRGLGCAEPVTSPTFVLVQRYFGRLPIWHVDLYRLERATWEGLGLGDELDRGVTIVEWADRLHPSSDIHYWIDVRVKDSVDREICIRSESGEIHI